MRVIPIRPSAHSPHEGTSPQKPDVLHASLHALLLGLDVERLPLPAPADILSAALALAEGSRRKSILPLGGVSPAELVLLRRGSDVLVSYYESNGTPEVRVLDRALPLRRLLDGVATTALLLGAQDSDPISRRLTVTLAERARDVEIRPMRDELVHKVRKRGGALDAPRTPVPLAFAFEALIAPVADPPRQTTAHSDVHALLFEGSLFVWARGRRIPLLRGPIMLAISRMVAAVRALVEARERRRPANVRLRAGQFVVGIRVSREGEVQLRLGNDLTIPELTAEEAALPILRLASDVLRALVSVDRTQTQNLRVSSLRDEVRALRRRVRAGDQRARSVVHDDPDRLRAAHHDSARPEPSATSGPAPRALRFEPRWECEVEGLDAASTFLCGDRLIVATPRHTVAIARDDARVLWAHEQPASASFMAGRVLARIASDGRLSLCDVIDGEPFAEAELMPRLGGVPKGILAGGDSVPPVVVLTEGRAGLVAVDLRNGELRWRHSAEGPGTFTLVRAGRILLITSGDGTIGALDVVTGELLWRFALDDERFLTRPALCGDIVLAASGEPGCDRGSLVGVDLFSGRAIWRRRLDAPPASAPIATADVGAVVLGSARGGSLAAFEPRDGSLRWMAADPGASYGGSCLAVDRLLIVNAPAGSVEALDLDDGHTRWRRHLADPVADDVPRRLEPVLRGGALFVPSASVHVLRPHDGASIGEPLPCELIPDWTRVDERGWVYVAEESGHLCALAPRPTLTLVR